jgi:glycosyltransferase involved in cell wall biosynthesis
MISILIPIYKWDTSTLINSLVKQANNINVPYEIIAIDDFSNSKHDVVNFSMNQYDFVEVYRNEKNLGRSKTRNKLAAKANYDWLLFVDSDSWIEDNFLINYLKEIKKSSSDVIVGGTKYSDIKPTKKDFVLHWKYGKAREEKEAEERKKFGLKSFTSNNFAIKSLVFSSIQFDESIDKYGHEDTLLGKQLGEKSYTISHVNNPVKHLGLVDNETFVKNSETAIENLVMLYKSNKLSKEDVNILTFYFKRPKITSIFSKFSKDFAKKRAINQGCLYFFDLYRLIFLTEKLVG